MDKNECCYFIVIRAINIQYVDFTLRQQKLDLCFHHLFGNWALPLTFNISVISLSI